MKRVVLAARNGIDVNDLAQSLTAIDRACSYVRETVSRGGTILFVGTQQEVQEALAEQAIRVGMPYVNERWLGGMLTNFQTVHKRLQRLKELEQIDLDDLAGSGMPENELLALRHEKGKLERTLGGMRDMTAPPSAIWVVNTTKEAIAVREARKLDIPVIAILDSNSDSDVIDFPVPGDDVVRTVSQLTRLIADAAAEGLMARVSHASDVTAEELGEPPPRARKLRALGGTESISGNASKRHLPELKEAAVRMYAEIRGDQQTDWAAMARVAELLGVSTAETVRKWVRQAEVDQGAQPGTMSEESAEIKRLKRENAELKRANAILKAEAPTMDSRGKTSASTPDDDYW